MSLGLVLSQAVAASDAPPAAASGLTGDCLAVSLDIESGALIAPSDLRPAACDPAAKRAAVRFDRSSGQLHARADIPASTLIGRVSAPDHVGYQAGEALVFEILIGAIRVERRVWAMQPQGSGDRLFVRDEAGHVFAAPIANLKPAAETRL